MCGAALHSGVIDNDGGWLDVTRLGRKQQFTKSYKNGIQSLGYVSVSVFLYFFFKMLIKLLYLFIYLLDANFLVSLYVNGCRYFHRKNRSANSFKVEKVPGEVHSVTS